MSDDREQLRESEAQLAADLTGMRRLYELYARLASEADLNVALHEILAVAVEFVDTDRGCVQLVSDDRRRLEIVAHHGYGTGTEFTRHFLKQGSEPACDAVRRKAERMVIEDVANFPPLAGTEDREICLAEDIRATCCTPMITKRGELAGVLCTQFRRPHHPSEEQLRLVDLLCWSAAELVERNRAE